jgi:hypothetical protein
MRYVEDPKGCLVYGLLVLEPALDLVDEADCLGKVNGILVAVEVLELDGKALGQENALKPGMSSGYTDSADPGQKIKTYIDE